MSFLLNKFDDDRYDAQAMIASEKHRKAEEDIENAKKAEELAAEIRAAALEKESKLVSEYQT